MKDEQTTSQRHLLCLEKVMAILDLGRAAVEWLVSTYQLTPIRIRGELRFDSRDLDALIDTYKSVAKRTETTALHNTLEALHV